MDSENGKKIISGIFKNINTIDNPFLKELIIEKILPDSYYHKFNYNGNEYDAGKNDHDKWSIFINDFCSSVCQIEKRIYPILLFYHFNDLIKINEKSDVLNQYENLFAKNIYDIKLNKEIPTSRSNRFPKLLKIALLASFHWGKLDIFQNSLPK